MQRSVSKLNPLSVSDFELLCDKLKRSLIDNSTRCIVRGHLRKAAVDFARKEYEDCIEACKEAQKYDTDGKSSREIQQQIQKAYAAMNPYSGGNSDESQEEVLKRAAQDPEVQRILGDPVMQQILQQMQQDPKAAQEHLKNPQVAANIRRLMSAGILKMA
jgi:stress-induced-phosphoprotein 1